MKIIAVGMNYVAHCHELHADEKLPEEPVIFMKPDIQHAFLDQIYLRESYFELTPGLI